MWEDYFFNSVKVYFNWSLSLLWMKWCHHLGTTWIGAFYSLAHMVLLSKHFCHNFFQSTEIRRGPKSRAWRVLDGVNAVHVGASHPQLHGWSLQTSKWCQTMKSNMNPLTPLSDQDSICPYNYIFPFMSYEDALKKSGLINLCQRREDACVTFLKRSYYSSDLLRNLVPRCQFSRPYALRAGRTVSVPTSSRSIRFGNFCTIKYQNHV